MANSISKRADIDLGGKRFTLFTADIERLLDAAKLAEKRHEYTAAERLRSIAEFVGKHLES